MKFCYLSFTLFIVLAISCKIQHLDKREYGYKGRIKKITITTNLDGHAWEATRNQYFFNRKGNFDSTIFEAAVPISDYNIRMIATYHTLNGNRFISERDELGRIYTVAQYWLNAYSYELVRTQNGRLVTKEKTGLSKNFRQISRYTYRNVKDTAHLFKQEYYLVNPKSGLLEAVIISNTESNIENKEFYRYSNFDKKRNPLAVTVTDSTGKALNHKIFSYEYY